MKKIFLPFAIVFLSLLFFGACSTGSTNQNKASMELEYPDTKKTDHVDTYFGKVVPDPYQWLEDDMSEETAEWVKAENEVTFNYLDRIGFRDRLEKRIETLLDYERISAPIREGNYEYFYRNEGLQNHSVVFRTRIGEEEGSPEVFLDPNTFSEDGTIALRGIFFTKDGSLAAHMLTEGGSDWRKVIVRKAISKEVIGDTIVNVKFSGVSWKGNDGFYYSSYDNPENTSELSARTHLHKLFYHKLGTPQSQDLLVFGGEKQPNRYIFGQVTEDGKYLIVTAAQNTSGNRAYVMRLDVPGDEFVLLQDDYMRSFNYVENEGDDFYFSTDIDAPNYRVVKVNLNAPAKENWQDIIQETKNVLSASSGGGKIFGNYLIDAQTSVKQFDLDGKLEREIELPGIGTASGFGAKREETELYYSFTSFTTPATIYKYDINSGKSTLYRKPDVEFNPAEYVTKQVFYKSKDGTRVPMFIVHKKGIAMDGKNPTWLYGYGGFNVSQTPSFSASRIVWLENGGIYAQPSLRGGGEYGEEWHEAGTKMQKQNVFDDFIAAAEYLFRQKYTSSDYLALSGGSNGGLLVGATMTQRPGIAKVALPAVGVLDMLKYHTFTAGAGWAADYGTAEDSPEMFEYLKNYSPYHALTQGTKYPATMVTTSDHDDRVVPAHSFKFAARLQEYNAGDNPVLIRIQTKAGHGSVSLKQQIAYISDQYAFAWQNMGIEPQLKGELLD